VRCTGASGAACSLIVRLTVVETIKSGKVIAVAAKAKPNHRVVVLGTATVTVAVGQSRIVTVSLKGAGNRLLVQRHTLKVKLTITQASTTVFSSNVTFRIQVAKKKH
jgi:hypothetical protein